LALLVEAIGNEGTDIEEQKIRKFCLDNMLVKNFLMYLLRKPDCDLIYCLRFASENISTENEIYYVLFNIIKQLFEKVLFDNYSTRRQSVMNVLLFELFRKENTNPNCLLDQMVVLNRQVSLSAMFENI
jgi:hypothetical protein